MPLTKTCRVCGQELPIESFYRNARYKGGYKHECKECHYKKPVNDGKRKLTAFKSLLKTKYGITVEQYDEMHKQQDGKCAICGASGSKVSKYKRLLVDHDHETGKVRGLLCQPCNLVLGYVEDNPERLHQAVTYLKERTT